MTPYFRSLGVAAATATSLLVNSAWAQEKPEATNLDEVVVTAQKFSQSVIDVPLSISVLGATDLERTQAANFQDFVKQVPGLQLTQATPGFGRLVLRGINTNGAASAVGVYVDETPFGSSSGIANGAILAGDFDTFDVARVEVLRGPQGTLYGASSLGGVLKYVTNEPQFDSFQGRVRAGFESVDGGDMSYSGAAVANMPVSDTVAIRASGFYRKVGGYIDSIGTGGSDVADNINGSTVSGGRASMLFKPSDAFSLRLSAYIQDIDNDASSVVDSDSMTGESLYGGLTQSQFVPETADVSYRVYNATAVWNVGFADLTSSTSYGTNTQDFRVDFTTLLSPTLEFFFGVPNESYNQQTTSVKRFTEELRLSSHESERLDWLVGAYYNDEDGLIDQNVHAVAPGTLTDIDGLPVLGVVTLDSKYKEYAAFANATIKFSPSFDLTLGGRYSRNDQDVVQSGDGLLFGGAPSTIPGDSSENVFTYSLAPKFKFNDRMAIYARIAKGFRPGGPNVIAPGAPPGTPTSYNSDSTINYELGVKGENEARTFGFDAAAFHIDWKDIQLLAAVNGVNINTNASGADSDGVEASLMFRPVDALRLSLSGAYTDAKLSEDTDLQLVGGREGDRLPYTPKTSYTASADYEWTMAADHSAYLGASFSHLSDVPAAFDAAFVAANDRQRFLPSYDMLDVRAGWDFGKVSLEVFGRNLTNDEGKTSDASGNTPLGAIATGVIRPRSYGMTVTAEF
jgi:outer membrane receptor protein involved in Fe transport